MKKKVKQNDIQELLEKAATDKFNAILKNSILPNSDFLIKELERTQAAIESNTVGISNILKANQEQFKFVNKIVANIPTSLISVSNLYAEHFEAIRKIQEQILLPSSIINQALQPLLEPSKVFESMVLARSNIAKQLQGLAINLPMDGYLKELSTNTSFELTLCQFSSIKSQPNTYVLDGSASETVRYEKIGIRLSTNFEMKLASLNAKIDRTDSKIDYLIESDKRKDEMILELIEYVKSTGNTYMKIEKVEYNKASTEILLNDQAIKLRANTNQSDVCRVLLKSKEAMQKEWEMEDIIEEIDESESDKNWHRAIYDAVDEVNVKILLETKGVIPDFFVKTMKTVRVNPKYIS